MRVLLIGPDWEAIARLRSDLIQDMIVRGWSVTVASSGETRHRASLEALGAEASVLPLSRNSLNVFADLSLALSVYRLCRRLKPDAVLTVTIKPSTIGVLAAALAGTPVTMAMITGLGYAFTEGREFKRLVVRTVARLLYFASLRTARRAIFQNDDDIAEFRNLGLLPKAMQVTRTNGSGVDLAHFSPVHLPEGKPTLLMVARLLVDKGVREYVEAARQARKINPEMRFQLLGPFDSNPAAISPEQVQVWDEEGIIEYLGQTDDVRPFLAQAHVFVLPSYREGTPRSALEALAVGRPVLTTDVPGCREVVRDGVTGRLVPVKDSATLAEAALWFFQDRQRLQRLSEAARLDAEARFDTHQVSGQIIEAIVHDVDASRQRRGSMVPAAAAS